MRDFRPFECTAGILVALLVAVTAIGTIKFIGKMRHPVGVVGPYGTNLSSVGGMTWDQWAAFTDSKTTNRIRLVLSNVTYVRVEDVFICAMPWEQFTNIAGLYPSNIYSGNLSFR